MFELWIIGAHIAGAHLGNLPDPGSHRTLWTPGIYAVAPSGFTIGAYRNSLSHTPNYPKTRVTTYAGWTWQLSKNVNITAAAATGYVEKISPLIAVSYSFGQSGARMSWVPHKTHPVSLSIETQR
jgi:hypothetical protein